MASRKESRSPPVPGHVSLASDAESMGRPILFKPGPPDELQPRKESGSPSVPGHVSLMSDAESMGRPILFKHGPPGEQPSNEARRPESSYLSLKSEQSMRPPMVFKEGGSRAEAEKPKIWSLQSYESMGRPILFNDEHPSISSREKTMDTIFMELERTIVSFVQDELRSFRRVLELEHQESVEGDESDQKTKEAFLNITLEFLKKMNQHTMADWLQSRYIQKAQRKMKSNLQQKFHCVFEGVPKAGNPTLLNQIYTDLYITKGGTDSVNEEHEIRQIETTSRRQTQSETTIKCKDIFQTTPEESRNMRGNLPIRTVLTKGVAGIGKTVLTQKFSLDWAEGKANQNIQLLFPFTFRELNVLRREQFSLMGLVHHFFGCLSQIHTIEHLNVVFIFDGLDECRLPLDFDKTKTLTDVLEHTTLDVLLVNLIKGTLLPNAHIWITTRPAAANQIPANYVTMVTEVRGFTNNQKDKYFTKRFQDREQAAAIIAHVKGSRTLYIMCHMPIFCWITAAVLEHVIRCKSRDPLPQTLTEMYIYFLVVQIKAKNLKYDNQTESEWSAKNIEMVESLAKLAFEQLLSGNLIFYESDLVNCGLDVHAASSYSGVFTLVFREEPGLYQYKVYSFVHLSVQEFLAALHVHHTFTKSGLNLLSVIKPSGDSTPEEFLYQSAVDQALRSPTGHLDLFLRFLLGLSLPTNQRLLQGLLIQTGTNSQTHGKTVEYIKQKLNEGLPTERSINLFHCLNELKDCSLVDKIQSFAKGLEGFYATLSPAEWSAVAFVLLSSDLEVFDLKKFQASEEVLLRLMPVVNASEKAILSTCNLTENCCAPLSSVISSPVTNLRHLDLSQNPILDSGVDQLCSGLKREACRLETLNLSLCNLSWRSCGSLSSVLSSQSCSLRHLDLSNNDLTDSGVDQVCAGLRRPGCGLVTLSLSGCLVTDKCSSSLALSLMTPKSCLKTLDLSYNNPGDSALELLSSLWGDSNYALDTLILEPAGHQWLTSGLRKYFCSHTLDSNTAFPQLSLSNRTVTRAPMNFPYRPHRDRFDYWPQVLCCNALSGRCYWEVGWTADWPGEKTRGVDIAVSYRSIGRKGPSDDCGFGFNLQSWSLMVCYGYYFFRHNGNETKVGTFTPSNRGQVAVYLDCPAGVLSFYRVFEGKLVHIHTVNTTFTGPLFAGFGVWSGTSVSLPNQSSLTG